MKREHSSGEAVDHAPQAGTVVLDAALSAAGERIGSTIQSSFNRLGSQHDQREIAIGTPIDSRIRSYVDGLITAVEGLPDSDKPILLRQIASCLDAMSDAAKVTLAAKRASIRIFVAMDSSEEVTRRTKAITRGVNSISDSIGLGERDQESAVVNALNRLVGMVTGLLVADQREFAPADQARLLAHLMVCLVDLAHTHPDCQNIVGAAVVQAIEPAWAALNHSQALPDPLNLALAQLLAPYRAEYLTSTAPAIGDRIRTAGAAQSMPNAVAAIARSIRLSIHLRDNERIELIATLATELMKLLPGNTLAKNEQRQRAIAVSEAAANVLKELTEKAPWVDLKVQLSATLSKLKLAHAQAAKVLK